MSIKRVFIKWLSIALLCVVGGAASAIELADHPKVKIVADKLIQAGHYDQAELDAIFAKATVRQSILDAMMNPAEYKFTWGKYRKLFMQADRIQQGVDFWQAYQSQLSRAEKEYGVPAHVIVAIIGVESKFGKFKGKHKVLDSLVSLVTGFPRRSAFFADELEQFLILTKENQLDPTGILGSYAGAVGYPQFISSSYRNYAIDFNKDGKTDLINQVDDAIGSIANYFIENGWKPGQPVTSGPHMNVAQAVSELASRKRKVQHTAAKLRSKGAVLTESIDDDEKLGVLMLDASEVVRDKKESGVYIVRAGDTICEIAEVHKVSCKQLRKLNNVNVRGDIFRGQRLKLPRTRFDQDKSATKNTEQKAKLQASKWEVATNKNAETQSSKLIEDGPRPVYFYTHHNFYAITQYNHSVLYAMAVHDLSLAIESAYKSSQRTARR